MSIHTSNMYTAFGFKILSDIPLIELLQNSSSNDFYEITIKQANLEEKWNELAQESQFFFITEEQIMYQIPNVATFLIKGGNQIFYTPMETATEDHLRLYLLGTCMGAILIQRKILPLHGSAVEIDGKAYAIVGESGAGKSTTASALMKKGFKLISDDVIPVNFNEQGIPVVTPAYPQQKLWQNSLDQFGMNSNQLRPIVERETKFAIPVQSQFCYESIPLAGIFELTKVEREELTLSPIESLQRLHTLFLHTYRNFFLERAGLLEWHFHMTVKMANKLEMYHIQRPVSRFTAHELTDVLLSTINKEEVVHG